MNQLTYMTLYYNQPEMLRYQVDRWLYFKDLPINWIIIDDGSPEPLPLSIVAPLGDRVSVYQILEDIPWNMPGARNLGFYVATTQWVLSTDIDHTFDLDGLRKMVYHNLNVEMIYQFARKRHDGKPELPHICTILITRDLFWKLGGYDEDFSGHYGHDDMNFRSRWENRQMVVLDVGCVCHSENPLIPDSVVNLNRDEAYNKALFRLKKSSVPTSYMRFKWRKVTP